MAKFLPLLLSFLSGSAIVGLLGLRFQRLTWLHGLFENFYNNDQYKGVRRRIDYEDLDELLALLDKSDANPQELQPKEKIQIDQFTDYLNFFEWIAFLRKKHQLGDQHVDALFKYYIVRFLQVDKTRGGRLRKYIRDHGYELLEEMLARYATQVQTRIPQNSSAAASSTA